MEDAGSTDKVSSKKTKVIAFLKLTAFLLLESVAFLELAPQLTFEFGRLTSIAVHDGTTMNLLGFFIYLAFSSACAFPFGYFSLNLLKEFEGGYMVLFGFFMLGMIKLVSMDYGNVSDMQAALAGGPQLKEYMGSNYLTPVHSALAGFVSTFAAWYGLSHMIDYEKRKKARTAPEPV